MDIKGDLNRIGKDKYGYLQDISEGYLDGIFGLEISGDMRRSWDILVGYRLLEMSPKDLQDILRYPTISFHLQPSPTISQDIL